MRSLTLALCATLGLSACAADAKDEVAEDFGDLAGLDDKSDAFSYRMKIVGSLDYGQVSDPVAYSWKPRFRAFKFAGDAGDEIDVWVRSADGDPVTWVLDDSFRVVASNDDADTSTLDSHVVATLPPHPSRTHYIVFRDYWLDSVTMTVELGGRPALTACDVDADCALVERGCCALGDWTAVRADQVEAYEASKVCDGSPCPLPPSVDRGTRALCNNDRKVCEAVDGEDIACGGRSLNPHECATGWICSGPGLAVDGPGACYRFCGGFGNFGCPDGYGCADDPYDGCDPAAGGADCGGICMSL